jgi:hypothetical protein
VGDTLFIKCADFHGSSEVNQVFDKFVMQGIVDVNSAGLATVLSLIRESVSESCL